MPKPGQGVATSVKVLGTSKGVDGTIRIRIKDSNGITLVEKPVAMNGGTFSGSMGFSPPANPEKGAVEAFVNGEGGVEKDMVAVPVTHFTKFHP